MIDPCHYPKLIGDRLRALRESRGMTHTHVSRVMGVGRSTVCRLEQGHHTPHLDSIARFARACGYDMRDVLSCVTDVQDTGSIVGVEPSCSDVPGSAPVAHVAPTGEVALPTTATRVAMAEYLLAEGHIDSGQAAEIAMGGDSWPDSLPGGQ